MGTDDLTQAPPEPERRLPNVPLGLVLASCPEIRAYADGPIQRWHHLVQAADRLRPIMGISPSAWDDARAAMGPEESAVVLAAMLERYAEIKSPGGYLRSLADKAAAGAFSCGLIVMALMRKAAEMFKAVNIAPVVALAHGSRKRHDLGTLTAQKGAPDG